MSQQQSSNNPYPVIYEEHDGSWTWSIEVGEAFEDNHQVLDRNDGYLTRRDAQVAMSVAMQNLGSTPIAKIPHTPVTSSPKIDKQKPQPQDDPLSPIVTGIPPWAVVKNSKTLALFQTQHAAKKYCLGMKGASVKRARLQLIIE